MKKLIFTVAVAALCACNNEQPTTPATETIDSASRKLNKRKIQMDILAHQSDSLRTEWQKYADSLSYNVDQVSSEEITIRTYQLNSARFLNRQLSIMKERKRVTAQMDSISKLPL